jgi:hypothetical protein
MRNDQDGWEVEELELEGGMKRPHLTELFEAELARL